MAWGTDSLFQRVWKAHGVQTFVIPAPRGYLSRKPVVASLATSLPSLTHLHVEHEQGASRLSTLLQRIGGRLTFLRGSTGSLLLQLTSAALSCTALESLCIIDRSECGCGLQQARDMLACLTACPSLTELTVIDYVRTGAWPDGTTLYPVLPQLRHLHVRTAQRVFGHRQPPELPFPVLTPNLARIALVLCSTQPVDMCESIDTQSLPHLTHCHIDCIDMWGPSREWIKARERLKARLGAVWCETENEVARWRADRAWKRSVGLPDEVEDYSA